MIYIIYINYTYYIINITYINYTNYISRIIMSSEEQWLILYIVIKQQQGEASTKMQIKKTL